MSEARTQLVSQIKVQYQEGEIEYIYAIEALQRECGYTAREAEELVNSWEDEIGS
jgi:hypothetical protein